MPGGSAGRVDRGPGHTRIRDRALTLLTTGITTHIVTQVVKEIVANDGVPSRPTLAFRRGLDRPALEAPRNWSGSRCGMACRGPRRAELAQPERVGPPAGARRVRPARARGARRDAPSGHRPPAGPPLLGRGTGRIRPEVALRADRGTGRGPQRGTESRGTGEQSPGPRGADPERFGRRPEPDRGRDRGPGGRPDPVDADPGRG